MEESGDGPCGSGPDIEIDGRNLGLGDVVQVARQGAKVSLSHDPGLREALAASSESLRRSIDRGMPLYGVTTGFGDSAHRQISAGDASRLQDHLLRFLGCGTGPVATVETVRAVMLIRANTLARGHSGVRAVLVEQLLHLLNHEITPLVLEEGSVGASGDLVPLSYVAAALCGSRSVVYKGEVQEAGLALERAGLAPLRLEPKEGLALVNGTAFMTGLAVVAAADAGRLARLADLATAMTVEALRGLIDPFDAFAHDIAKPHPGQIASAARIRSLLEGSRLATHSRALWDVGGEASSSSDRGTSYRELSRSVQDKYSVRCAPHFVGVLWDTLEWVDRWLTVEINSSNDNPLIDPAIGSVVSCGNFAGGHVALAMDSLRTAAASVADLLDRQLALIVDEKFNAGLTPNLVRPLPAGDPDEGLNHGFKGMQLACSSLAAEALSLAMPLAVFSRSTECHNQDKVSMGATAARRTRDVVALTEKVAAIHLLALCQAADLRGPEKLGGRTRAVYDRIRSVVPPLAADRPMDRDVTAVVDLIRDDTLLAGLP